LKDSSFRYYRKTDTNDGSDQKNDRRRPGMIHSGASFGLAFLVSHVGGPASAASPKPQALILNEFYRWLQQLGEPEGSPPYGLTKLELALRLSL
jgi:hypothetical protein